jgi:hypothetical protein
MNTNTTFSFQRFFNLCKQSAIINRKSALVALGGFSGAIFLVLFILQLFNQNYIRWSSREYFTLFMVVFIGVGIIYASNSFPAFRGKEKSISYLMLPVSPFEKFTFEILTRIVLFILLVPPLFWVVANIEGRLMYIANPEFVNYKFFFQEGIKRFFFNNNKVSAWQITFIISSIFLFFSISFTGASHFRKNPLVKTLLSAFIIIMVYIVFSMLLHKILDLKNYIPVNNRVLFIHGDEDVVKFFSIFLIITNLVLFTISYLKINEKEV